jgi:TonB-linked SusC/RagA family outer membrane protein
MYSHVIEILIFLLNLPHLTVYFLIKIKPNCMRKNLLLKMLPLFLMLLTSMAWAQERTVTGRVTSSEDGSSLPGVNVVVKGTTNGSVTDADGQYSLSVPASGVSLIFSFIGLKTQEISIGDRTVIDVQLALDETQLSEVVVTALGISRETKSLPYASQQVNADKLSITRANNINDALAGKVAGIQVLGQSGAKLGSNSVIRIRGASSLEEQGNDPFGIKVQKGPLFVLDGTPVSSQDINPDDIETTNVLKGPAATALYGQRGDAGVIMLTSKKGKKGKGIGITLNQSYFLEKVYILPRQQNSYAGGAFSELAKFTYQPGMPTEWQSLDGKYYPDYTDDGSWGPRMIGQEYIPWYAWAPGTKYTGKTAKLTPQPNNIRDFYGTGINRITNLSFSKAEDDYSIRVGYTNQGQIGIMPNTGLSKNTLSTQFSANLSKLVTVGANINYVNQKVTGEFDDAYSNQTSGSFNQWFHRDLDMNILNELSGLKSPEGRYVSWNHFNPTSWGALGDKVYRGYYWYGHKTYLENINYTNNRNRLFGDVNIRFNISKSFSIAGFYRKSEVTSDYEDMRPSILPRSFNTELRPNTQAQWDYYGTGQSFSKEDNIEVLASYNGTFLDGKLSVTANAGGNIRMEKSSSINSKTNLGLVVPDLFTLSNSKTQPFLYDNNRFKKEVRSIYARGTFGYKDMIYLDWSVRNDWSSALPAKNNSYLYPSVGTSIVFSELTESALPFLSLGKLRASFAQVGSDQDSFQTSLLYKLGDVQWNGNSTMATPNRLVDPNISPALSTATELGLDLKFFQNRAGLSATYYNTDRTKEIIPVAVDGASGFTSKVINAGRIQNRGFELALEATPIKTGSFEWNTTLNFARNVTEIIELVPGVNAIAQNGGNNRDAFATATIYNIVGQKWGQLRGFGTQKIDGQPVLTSEGLFTPIQNQSLGSVLPDFTGGFINYLTYKNFTLSANIDFQSGGKFFSLSDYWGTFSGLTERTAQMNDRGVPERTPVADGGGVHVFGVDETGAKKDYYVDGKTYYQQFGNNGIAENSIYDLTFIKLREVNIAYRIPVQNLGIGKVLKTASISFVARNLWLIYSPTKDFDASVISNTFGENGQFPGTRSMGVNLKLGF